MASDEPAGDAVESGGERRDRRRVREPRDPRTELDVTGLRVARGPSALEHDRANPVQRALRDAGLASEVGERGRALAVEQLEHVEDGRDAWRSGARPTRRLVPDSGFHVLFLIRR